MNHFFLWVGPDAMPGKLGKLLLEKYKRTEAVTTLQGENWTLCLAAQQNGLGAFRNDRIRPLKQTVQPELDRRLVWIGHAWSASDGNQPPVNLMEKGANDLGAAQLVIKGREHSDGVFALMVIDETRREIAIASDLLGSFHIYYRFFPEGVALSNSSAVLAELPPVSGLDPVGVQELCSNSIPNEDRSLWREVKKLRSGEVMLIDTQRTKAERIHHRPLLGILARIDGYEKDPVPGVYSSMSGILQILHNSGGRGEDSRTLPWAVDLTGGNDSRALMAAIVAHQNIKVASTVSGPADDPDVQIGESLARKLGIPQFTRPPAGPVSFPQFMEALSLTDGEFDALEYAGIAAVHRQHICDGLQFSMNGSYCELARGHAMRLGLPGMLFPDRMSGALCRRTALDLHHPSVTRWEHVCSLKAGPGRLFSKAALQESEAYFPGLFNRLMAYAKDLPQHAQLDLIHLDLRMERWQGRLASSTNQLWPAISPWGFHAPQAAVLTTSPLIRRNGLLTRELTFRYAPQLASEPLYTGNPAMPFSLRHAHWFLPIVPFFAERAINKIRTKIFHDGTQASRTAADRQPVFCATPEIREWIRNPRLAATGLFDPDRLLAFLDTTHPQSDADHRLWCRLLTIEAALRRQAAL